MLDKATYKVRFGICCLTDGDGIDALVTAIESGYRHLDTARLYGNEEEIGEAIACANVDRDDLFVATKIAHFEESEKILEYIRNDV